jgi:hypothetical protein
MSIGNRESGIGSRGPTFGSRESGIGNRYASPHSPSSDFGPRTSDLGPASSDLRVQCLAWACGCLVLTSAIGVLLAARYYRQARESGFGNREPSYNPSPIVYATHKENAGGQTPAAHKETP